MDKYNLITIAGLGLAFLLVFGCLSLLWYVNPTRITGNKTVTGIFEKIEIKNQDVTIYFKDYSSVTFWQSSTLGYSLQVPFVVGHTYQLILAVHSGDYMTLQSVVEVP